MSQLLEWAASTLPRRTAITFGDTEMTFAQCRQRALRAANALRAVGIRHGDRVVIWCDLSLSVVDLRFGLAYLGSAFAPLNPGFGATELSAALAYLNPRLLVVDLPHAEIGAAAAADLNVPVAVIGGGGVTVPGTDLDLVLASATDGRGDLAHAREDDVDSIFLTSGSTGQPKGVMLSHRAQWLRAFAGTTLSITSGGAGRMNVMPLFHMAGWNFLHEAWSHGTASHLVRPEPAAILRTIARHRPGVLYAIPAVWQRILGSQVHVDSSSLRWALTGTSLVSPDLLRAIKDRFPDTRTTLNYGSTEAGQAVALADEDLFRKPGAVGLPVPGTFVRLGDDGELLLSSPWLMSGYYALPDETAQALDGGWYHTGDLVSADDEGYLSIVGRKKEMIRSGGESIAPVEVESVLRVHPKVREIAVVGQPDSRWGEVVCAVVVLQPGAAPVTVEELRSFAAGRLAPFKRPRQVLVVDELPTTAATGQTQRSRLRGITAAGASSSPDAVQAPFT